MGLAALALLGLAASLAANSPVHPRSVAKPSAPRRVAPQQATRAVVEPVEVDDPAARCRALAEELGGLLAAEWIGDLPPHGEERLQRFLVDLLLDGGFPDEAIAALRRTHAGAQECCHAGWRLQNGGELALAARAFRLGVERAPDTRWVFDALAEVDPAGALEVLEGRPAWVVETGYENLALLRAQLLERSGRTQEAVSALRSSLEVHADNTHFWAFFLELAPDLAERELLAHLREQPTKDLCGFYARRLDARGEGQRAGDLFEQLVLVHPEPGAAAETLVRFDRERARCAILTRLARDPGRAELWSRLGEVERDAGRTADAVEAWQRAFELEPASFEWTEELLRWAPERVTPRCLAAMAGNDDPWSWGEVGEVLWRAGHASAAQEAWSAARALDPEEEWWLERLVRASGGLDPLDG